MPDIVRINPPKSQKPNSFQISSLLFFNLPPRSTSTVSASARAKNQGKGTLLPGNFPWNCFSAKLRGIAIWGEARKEECTDKNRYLLFRIGKDGATSLWPIVARQTPSSFSCPFLFFRSFSEFVCVFLLHDKIMEICIYYFIVRNKCKKINLMHFRTIRIECVKRWILFETYLNLFMDMLVDRSHLLNLERILKPEMDKWTVKPRGSFSSYLYWWDVKMVT